MRGSSGRVVGMDIYGFAAGPYQANTYIIAHAGHAVVVDPGMHAKKRVDSILADHDLVLDAIVLTHGHIDHTREAGEIAFQYRVAVYIHPADKPMLDKGKGMSEQTRILFDAQNMLPIADIRSLDGDSLDLIGHKFLLRHAPGHSPGCVLIIGSEFAFTGDVIFRGAIGRTDLAGSDPTAMELSLAGPVWQLDDSLTLLPGHGPTTTMRAERATNPFLANLRQVV